MRSPGATAVAVGSARRAGTSVLDTPGKRVAHARRAAGLTQAELAAKLGVRLNVVDRYETGEVEIPSSHAKAIAEATEVAAAWLHDGSETADQVALLERLQRGVDDLRVRLERVEGGKLKGPSS